MHFEPFWVSTKSPIPIPFSGSYITRASCSSDHETMATPHLELGVLPDTNPQHHECSAIRGIWAEKRTVGLRAVHAEVHEHERDLSQRKCPYTSQLPALARQSSECTGNMFGSLTFPEASTGKSLHHPLTSNLSAPKV